MIGCDTKEEADTTPPNHMIKLPTAQGKYRFGVTDTVAVDFSEDIDTSALTVEFGTPGVGKAFKGLRKLLIFGTGLDHGEHHFVVNAAFTAVFSGFRDLAGNGDTAFQETFVPYPWIDRDYADPAYVSYDSVFASDSTWIDGSPLTDTLVSEGSMDFFRALGETLDPDDFKLVRLIGSDTLALELTARKDLDVSLQTAGPFAKPQDVDTAKNIVYSAALQTGTTGKITTRLVADKDTHKRLFGSFEAPAFYLVRLTLPKDKEGFYRLKLQVRKFQ